MIVRAVLAFGLLLALGPATAGAAELLSAERAFAYSAQALGTTVVEARFTIAPGYYLYRDRLHFSVAPGSLAATPKLPPGKIKDDPFFGSVEIYRGALGLRLDLAGVGPGVPVTVTVESQGCADAGVCYPAQRQSLTVTLPAAGAGPGPLVEFAPEKKGWFR